MSFALLGDAASEMPVLRSYGVRHCLRSLTADIDSVFLASDGLGRANAALVAEVLCAPDGVAALRVGPSVASSTKIACIDLSYRDHAEEKHAEIPREPVTSIKDLPS